MTRAAKISNEDEKVSRRLERQFNSIERSIPHPAARALHFLRQPIARLIRVPIGLVFVLGGVFSFLPVLGIWMLPLGLLLLAVDLHLLRGPVTAAITRIRQFWRQQQRKRRNR